MVKKNSASKEQLSIISSLLSDEDIRLEKLFDEMETTSLATVENAARQIITLSIALLGAFFGLLAFKDALTYLGFIEIKIIGSLALTSFMLSLLLALRAVAPRRYKFPRSSLTAKRRILNEMLESKQGSTIWASWLFGIGAFLMLLAALDIFIIRI